MKQRKVINMNFEESIKTVVNAMAIGFKEESLENNQEAFLLLKKLHGEDESRFLDVLEIAHHDFQMLVESVINIPEQRNKNILPFLMNGLYEHFHKTRILKLEGMACCADKSGFIRAMTLKSLKMNENLSLYADYTNVDKIKKDKKRQAYWSPSSVKDTHEAMQLFWDWYQLKDM